MAGDDAAGRGVRLRVGEGLEGRAQAGAGRRCADRRVHSMSCTPAHSMRHAEHNAGGAQSAEQEVHDSQTQEQEVRREGAHTT